MGDSKGTKPHYGKITNWCRYPASQGLGYGIDVGRFEDHPIFKGQGGWTSFVVSHDETTGEIETKNSRYTLVGPGLK